MTKTCIGCRTAKALDDFHQNSAKSDGRRDICKACAKLYHREHYLKNRSTYITKNSERRIRWKLELRSRVAALKDVPCADCGNRFPTCVMDFDHLDADEKIDSLARMQGNGLPWRTVIAEIQKCEVVCANCHRLRTWRRWQTVGAGGENRTPITSLEG